MENTTYDVIVAGGGPAGLSAALTLGRSRRRVLVLDDDTPRNRFAAHMHTVLGHDGIPPHELRTRGLEEVARYGVEVRHARAASVADAGRTVEVRTEGGERLSARHLVAATGARDLLPDLPGLQQHWGRHVLHCPYCHGWEVREQRLGLLLLLEVGLHQAELLTQWTPRLTVFTGALGPLAPAVQQRLHAAGVEVVDTPVSEVLGDDEELRGVRLDDGTEVALDALFVGAPMEPHDGFLADLGLERSATPVGEFVQVDQMGRTSHPRVWGIGNVVNPMANVPISSAAGVLTGGAVNGALVTEDLDDAQARVATEFWDGHYARNERVWSGRVNATTAAVVAGLEPGEALELGCGEGGDAVWLAEQGWRVTAVDIAAAAVERGAAAARTRGVADRVRWLARDLSRWQPADDDVPELDLVTASFFHAPFEFPRAQVLQRAASRLRPGGHLLLVSHVMESQDDVPPWAWREGHDHPHMPREDVTALGLDGPQWRVVLDETRQREASAPDGEHAGRTAHVRDGVVLLQRVG